MKKSIKRMTICAILTAMCLGTSLIPVKRASAIDDGEKITISMIGKYDSADTAAIRLVDTDNKRIKFRNHTTGKTYTLNYDNTSMMYDARGTVLSASLLEPGQIVDVTFLKSSRHITTLNVSNEAWVIESTREHELVRGDGSAKIKDETYRIDNRTLVMADGQLANAEDILATDSVKVSGIGKDIYSVVVTSGHGYVSLSSDTVEEQSLVGAWLELDNEVIHKISSNMLLSAPEGEYNLQILGNGANYQSEININRNEETVIDTSNVTVERPKEGSVTFDITPYYADVFVDGERAITGIPQTYRYGYHNLKIMADGYITQDKYLKIGSPSSIISVELEKETESAEDASSYSTSIATDFSELYTGSAASAVSGISIWSDIGDSASTIASSKSSTSSSKGSSYKTQNKIIEDCRIYFDSPSKAELYFDGAYIGMIPISVAKITGTHEIILKRDGYETKSYRISIDDEETDETYTFPNLVKTGDLVSEEEDLASTLSASELNSIIEGLKEIYSDELTDEEIWAAYLSSELGITGATSSSEQGESSGSETSTTQEGGSGSATSTAQEGGSGAATTTQEGSSGAGSSSTQGESSGSAASSAQVESSGASSEPEQEQSSLTEVSTPEVSAGSESSTTDTGTASGSTDTSDAASTASASGDGDL